MASANGWEVTDEFSQRVEPLVSGYRNFKRYFLPNHKYIRATAHGQLQFFRPNRRAGAISGGCAPSPRCVRHG